MQSVTTQQPKYWPLFIALLAIPPVYLIISNQGVSDILRSSAPEGQLSYLGSRLIGLYAFIILCWQAMGALRDKIKSAQPTTRHIKRHILMGSSMVVLILLHSGLFINAVSVRSGHLSLHLLIPDFTNGYYNTAVSLGVLALVFTLIAVTAGLLRKRIKTQWKIGHALMFIVLVLVFFHAWMIGTDVQSPKLLPLFLLAAGCVLVLAVWRFLKGKGLVS